MEWPQKPKKKKIVKKIDHKRSKRRLSYKQRGITAKIGINRTSQYMTNQRLTLKLGLYNNGKTSKVVSRAQNPETEARKNQDLHKILCLANQDRNSSNSNPQKAPVAPQMAEFQFRHITNKDSIAQEPKEAVYENFGNDLEEFCPQDHSSFLNDMDNLSPIHSQPPVPPKKNWDVVFLDHYSSVLKKTLNGPHFRAMPLPQLTSPMCKLFDKIASISRKLYLIAQEADFDESSQSDDMTITSADAFHDTEHKNSSELLQYQELTPTSKKLSLSSGYQISGELPQPSYKETSTDDFQVVYREKCTEPKNLLLKFKEDEILSGSRSCEPNHNFSFETNDVVAKVPKLDSLHDVSLWGDFEGPGTAHSEDTKETDKLPLHFWRKQKNSGGTKDLLDNYDIPHSEQNQNMNNICSTLKPGCFDKLIIRKRAAPKTPQFFHRRKLF